MSEGILSYPIASRVYMPFWENNFYVVNNSLRNSFSTLYFHIILRFIIEIFMVVVVCQTQSSEVTVL